MPSVTTQEADPDAVLAAEREHLRLSRDADIEELMAINRTNAVQAW